MPEEWCKHPVDIDATRNSCDWTSRVVAENKAVSKRILSNTSTALLRGGYVFSAKTSGELCCLEASTGKQIWQTNTGTDLENGFPNPLTPFAESVFPFPDSLRLE